MVQPLCPGCGNEIDVDDPQGLCPGCLTRQAAQPVSEGDPLREALEAKLAGQYRLLRMLGRGGMGVVYLARDLTLDRAVAIKVLNGLSDSREMYERFRREARTAAKLSHPNIVPLHAFGEVEGLPYFVMGYVRGESLADRLHREGKLPEEDARRILGEIADALDHAHRQGVVHRDIKPDNVLLEDESERALLTDFGVARAVGKGETLTRMGSVVGTPHYMSPEQAAGRADIDGRSDIYSLGVMGYAMLTGRLPFEGNTPAEVLTKHLTQEPPALRSLTENVSDSTVQAVERCLAKDPAARWPDARSLKLALGVSEESHLPDALQAVEARGMPGLLITILLQWGMTLLFQGTPGDDDRLVVVFAMFVVLFYLFVIGSLRREGFSFRQSQSVVWKEPAWWPFWYPRPLRRRGNVWDRLPVTVRRFRGWTTGLVLFVLTGFFAPTIEKAVGDRWDRTVFNALGIAIVGVLLVVVAFRLHAKRDLKRRGLAAADMFRVIVSMPLSRVSFWARPHIAPILAPARAEMGHRSDSPHQYLQSILRQAGELSGPLRPLGSQAAEAARQLIGSIEHADRQISELARNLDPGEEDRLADKIDALAGVEEYASMRALLEKQRELIREMSGRIEQAKERRSRHVETLKTLALHVASLRERQTPTPSEVRLLSDNVRALCDEIERHAGALAAGQTMSIGEAAQMPTVDRP